MPTPLTNDQIVKYSAPASIVKHRKYTMEEYGQALELALRLAPILKKSRFVPMIDEEEGVWLLMKAYELGIPFTSAHDLIHPIKAMNGPLRLSLSPMAALGLVQHSGLLEDMKVIELPGSCSVYMKRVGGPSYSATMTMEMADKAGLTKSSEGKTGNWEKWGPNMLRWRAIGFVCDVLFSDVQSGITRADSTETPVTHNGNLVIETAQERADGAVETTYTVTDCGHVGMISDDVACPTCGTPRSEIEQEDREYKARMAAERADQL